MRMIISAVLALILIAVAVLLVFRKRGGQDPADIDAYMAGQAELTVKYARAVHSVDLDFSVESVEIVERILGDIHQANSAKPLSDSELEGQVIRWASYLGETAKRIRAGRWQRDSTLGKDTFPVQFDEQNAIFPIAWVHKRITNGEEDNVKFKFHVAMLPDSFKELSTEDLEGMADSEDRKK